MSDTLTPVLTRNWGDERAWKLTNYERIGGYQALRKALTLAPADVVEMVKDSGLRGRGGAGFPTGMKWSFIPQDNPKPKYLVVNADESEPGTCKDIPLMMASPHTLVEGVIISAYAIRAKHAFIYIRGEVLHVVRRLQQAVREAYSAGYAGRNVLGTGYDLEIIVHAGAGAYICGEETALLDSLEGRRGQPRLRPPFPAVAGLYASPTVINNVESIASVPSIVANGADWFSSMGTEKSKGMTIYSLSGHVTHPGQFEAPLGITLRTLLDLAGGIREGAPAEVLDPWRLLDPAAHRRAPGHPARLRGRGQREVDAGHQGAAVLRRDHLGGAHRAALDRVLQARVVRQVHPVPRGHLVAGADPEADGGRPGRGGRHREAARPLPEHPRPLVLRARRRRDLADHLGHPVLPQRVRGRDAHPRLGAVPVRQNVTVFRSQVREPALEVVPVTVSREAGQRRRSTRISVTLTIDDVEVSVPKGTLVIRAAELIGVEIPRFCDHPLLEPVGACRQCLVEVPDAGQRPGHPQAAGLLHP